MKSNRLPMVVLLAALALVGCGSRVDMEQFPAEPLQPERVVGIWEGELGELRIVIRLHGAGSILSGTIDSPDQGAIGIKIQQVRFDGQQLALEIASINAVFLGKLNDSGTRLVGQWIQNGNADLALDRVEKPSIRKRRQNPETPYPYSVNEVTFTGGAKSIVLSGTLVTPEISEFPVLILVSGSGPQDRDETLMGHKPFWVLSDFLARRGIATLRYDDRGVGHSTGNHEAATTADFAEDAQGAVAYLRTSEFIDSRRIGVLGHSEGGLVVAMLGADRRSDAISCGVMLAGPSVSGAEIHQRQIREMLEASAFPLPDSTISKVLALSSQIYPANYLSGSWKEKKRVAFDLYRQAYSQFNIFEKVILSIDGESAQLAEAIINPWFSFFLQYDPRNDLSQQQQPLLAVYGSLDMQVSSNQNVESLRRLNNDHIEIEVFPGLNHLFQHAETGLPDEYGVIEETLAPEVMETISNWTHANC